MEPQNRGGLLSFLTASSSVSNRKYVMIPVGTFPQLPSCCSCKSTVVRWPDRCTSAVSLSGFCGCATRWTQLFWKNSSPSLRSDGLLIPASGIYAARTNCSLFWVFRLPKDEKQRPILDFAILVHSRKRGTNINVWACEPQTTDVILQVFLCREHQFSKKKWDCLAFWWNKFKSWAIGKRARTVVKKLRLICQGLKSLKNWFSLRRPN